MNAFSVALFERLDEVPSAVRASIVYDQDVKPEWKEQDLSYHGSDILGLVIGRNDDKRVRRLHPRRSISE